MYSPVPYGLIEEYKESKIIMFVKTSLLLNLGYNGFMNLVKHLILDFGY